MATQRKRYSAQDKIELLRLHLFEHVSVPEICARQKIHPTIFYRWQRQLFNRGHLVFQGRSSARMLANYRRKLKALKIAARVREKELQSLKQQLRQKNSLTAALQKFATGPALNVAYSLQPTGPSDSGDLNRNNAVDESYSTPDVSPPAAVTNLAPGSTQPAQIKTGRAGGN